MTGDIVYRIKQPVLSYNQFWTIRDNLVRQKIKLEMIQQKNKYQEKELAEIKDTLDNVMNISPEYN